MDLRHLTDKALLIDTKKLVTQEREATVKVLHHIKEIDRRKLYSDLKYSSLFSYCVKELGYPESGAQRRIVAARLINEIPKLEEKISLGKVSLTNIALANKHFKENNIRDTKAKIEILKQIENLSSRECEKKLMILSGNPKLTMTTITISEETHKKFQDLKDLIGKNLTADEVIELMVEVTIDKIKREKFKQTRSKGSLPAQQVNRVIPAEIKRKVYKRDQKCVNCGSIHRLNYDHKKPYALGGNHTLENIRLLCFNCNQRARIRAKL